MIVGTIGVIIKDGRVTAAYKLQTDTEWRVRPTPPNNPSLRGRGEAAATPLIDRMASGSVRVKAGKGEMGG